MQHASFLIAQVGSQLQAAVGGSGGANLQSNQVIDTLLNSVTFLKNIALSVLILIVFYLIGKIIARRIVVSLKEVKGESVYPDMIFMINRLVVMGSLFMGFSLALQFIFGVDFLQIVGFFGLGISFAFKDLLSNLIAGAMIVIQNRFHIGDFIQVANIKGKIMEIQTRATILKAIDGTEIIIPNAELIVKPVITYTANSTRRIDFLVRIRFSENIQRAQEVAKSVLVGLPGVLQKPEPHVLMKEIGDSTITLKVHFWINPHDKEHNWVLLKSDAIRLVKEAFDREGIVIPFPSENYIESQATVTPK